jgi:hypothetical protein
MGGILSAALDHHAFRSELDPQSLHADFSAHGFTLSLLPMTLLQKYEEYCSQPRVQAPHLAVGPVTTSSLA